jgi:RNA polymerase sigma-70 factor, ECF subfamily
VRLYTPLLYCWARRLDLQPSEASDLVQDVFTLLVRKLPQFQYDPQKSFRKWLRTVLLNKWREGHRRRRLPTGDAGLAEASVPDPVDEFSEAEYRQHLVRCALQVMQREFQPVTWKACWEYLVVGRPATEVAAELGVSVDVVYSAKSRVLHRLRMELAGLLD